LPQIIDFQFLNVIILAVFGVDGRVIGKIRLGLEISTLDRNQFLLFERQVVIPGLDGFIESDLRFVDSQLVD